jgi:protease-4
VSSTIEKSARTEPIRATIVTPGRGGTDAPRVALIDVDGLIVNGEISAGLNESENPVALFREKLDAAASDPQVCALVVRINSPGGGVVASDIMSHDLQDLRKRTGLPLVAYVMELGTGGGYYLATAADVILAHPNSITGGIGVIFNHYSLLDTMATHGVISRPVKAGENIDMGTYSDLLQDESRAWLQNMANEYHGRFQQVVSSRRPAVNRDPSTFDGRIFAPGQALERGLIDDVGYLEQAISTAQEMAGATDCAVVMYHRSNNPPRSIYASDGVSAPLSGLLPMSVPGLDRSRLPRFLYLWQVDPTLERLAKP